jgi:hypothetical protein
MLVERLESRRNLSHFHIGDASLVISGTEFADELSLTYDSSQHLVRATNADRLIGTYSLHDFGSIRVEAGAGDDRIHIDPALPHHVKVVGGDGTDTLIGIRLPSAGEVLFTNGEAMTFENRSCLAVECVRYAEGESADSLTASTPAAPPVVPIDLEHNEHRQPPLAGILPDRSGEISNPVHAVMNHTLAGQHQPSFLLPTASEHSAVSHSKRFSYFGRNHGDTRGHSESSGQESHPTAGEHDPNSGAATSSFAPSTELSTEIDIQDLDAIMAGWTDGTVVATAVAAVSAPLSQRSSWDATTDAGEAKAESGGSDFQVHNVPAGIEDAHAIAPETDNRLNSVGGAIGIALAAATGAFLLERRENCRTRAPRSKSGLLHPIWIRDLCRSFAILLRIRV